MTLYTVARKDMSVRPLNLVPMMTTPIPGTLNDHKIHGFFCWHRKRDAQAYIDSYEKSTRKLFMVIRLRYEG